MLCAFGLRRELPTRPRSRTPGAPRSPRPSVGRPPPAGSVVRVRGGRGTDVEGGCRRSPRPPRPRLGRPPRRGWWSGAGGGRGAAVNGARGNLSRTAVVRGGPPAGRPGFRWLHIRRRGGLRTGAEGRDLVQESHTRARRGG